MIHRFGAVIAGTTAIAIALFVRKQAAGSELVRRLALVPVALVLLQVTLGVLSVLSLLDLTTITAHLAVGAALLGSFVVLWGLFPVPARPGEEQLVGRDPASRDAMVTS
jgi:heme A synthase